MEKEPSNETVNNSENELKLKKDKSNAENAAIDDDWDEDRIPIITYTIDVSKFLRDRNPNIDNDWIEAEDGRKSEITTYDENEVNVTSQESEKHRNNCSHKIE